MSELRASDALPALAALAEDSEDAVVVFDTKLEVLSWNARAEQLSERKAADAVGRSLVSVLPSLDESSHEDLLRGALEGRHGRTHGASPFAPRRRDGRAAFDTRVKPLRGASGQILGGLCVVRELTADPGIEERLAETESRFKNMADVSPVLLWMSGTDGLCTFFNQTWLDFTGRTLEEEWGVGWAEGVHFEDFQRYMDTYLDAFNRRRVFELEYRLRRRDGEYRWLLDRGTPRYLPDGAFAGFIGSCVDITEHKRLEQELRGAVRARDDFLSVASHELRTPLAALQLQLEMLQRSLERASSGPIDTEKALSRARKALEKTFYLGNMVDVLLDVSRMSEGRLSLEFSRVHLTQVTREVLEQLGEAARAASSQVELTLGAEPVGHWDRFRITQIVTNLVSNAIKYGAGRPISVRVDERDGSARLEVGDRGPGIPPEHRERIFERFMRFAPSSHFGGFGLGLWITKQLVTAHHGTVAVDDNQGGGARFVIELPLDRPAKAGTAQHEAP